MSKSWDNKIEIHPYHRFPLEDGGSEYLILGSFPPNKFTNYRERQTDGDVDFFYGSKDNSFWELFIKAKELLLKWPNDVEMLKSYLNVNKWMVSDIVQSTIRKSDSALDRDLQPTNWNIETIEGIFQNNSIRHLLFTSNWVKNNFNKKLKTHLKSSIDTIKNYTLISPSAAGLISTNWAREILPKEESESLETYREKYYKWVFTQIK